MNALDQKALAPCPFCDGRLSLVSDYDGDPLISHQEGTECFLDGQSWPCDPHAIARWNRRAYLAVAGNVEAVSVTDAMANAALAKSMDKALNTITNTAAMKEILRAGLAASPPSPGITEEMVERVMSYMRASIYVCPERPENLRNYATEILTAALSPTSSGGKS